MSKDLDNRYFIILNKDKIIFSCLNNENKISFTKSHILINGLNNLFGELEKFFKDNLINIEKSLNDYITKVYIIMDLENSLTVNLSIKYNHDSKFINEQTINDLLDILKYQFSKYCDNQKVIHMMVSKLLINGKEKELTNVNETIKNLIIEVKFECLKVQIINIIQQTILKYQISVEKILLADYLRWTFGSQTDDLVYKANRSINGENINEVKMIKKKPNKKYFFERFFNLFR
jgi:hypothetical protein